MDSFVNERLRQNNLNYKMALDRIIDKYSKLQYQAGGIEVDLNNATAEKLELTMRRSKIKLNKLDSKSLTDLREESLRAQDFTRDSQLDFTHQYGGADVTCVSSVSSNQSSLVDDGMAGCDTTQLTVSSSYESERSVSEMEFQPEDQDEELEMSLRSHGSTLVELYPSMISRIERARRRQHVSDAADSVLRRYRRWRLQPNRSNVNNTFIVTLRSNPKKMTSKMSLKEVLNSPVKIPFMGIDTTPRSPLQMMTNAQDWHAQQQSPGRVRGSLRREKHQPILVMDLSGSPENSLNVTFNVSKQEEQPSTYSVSPSRPSYPTAKASLDMSPGSKRMSLAAHSSQADRYSMHALQRTAYEQRPDIYGSPVRQSPFKARMIANLSGSPQAFSRSPRAPSVESFSREPMRHRSLSTSPSSPPQKQTVPLRMLYPQDSHHSFQCQLPSSQSATAAAGRHMLRRHLSFDSSLPSMQVSYSPKKFDKEYLKVYHKYICQNKPSFINEHPCPFCAQSVVAGRGHSSSALDALALSPHRSLLRKRHRELNWESHPLSKRVRDEYCASSPGTKRHGNEVLRRCLSTSEYEQSHDGLSYSPSKRNMFQRFSSQQRTWMSHGRNMSAAQFSSLENGERR